MRFEVQSLFCFYAAAWSLFACSAEQQGDKTKVNAVLTLSPASTEVLYWQDQNDIVRGNCIANKPASRSNCTLSVMRLSLAELNKRIAERLRKEFQILAKKIDAEAEELRNTDVSVLSLRQQINALMKQKDALSLVITNITENLRIETDLSAKLAEQLADYDVQLQGIDARLRETPGDSFLLALKSKVLDDRANYERKKHDTDARLVTGHKRLESQTAILIKLDSDLKAKQDELKTYLDFLELYSPKLDQLRHDVVLILQKQDLVSEVLQYIAKDDITYRDFFWSEDLRRALVLVNQAFSGSLGLKPGIFKVESGYKQFCPQKISVTTGADLDVVFLPPCASAEKIHICEKDVCRNGDSGTVITVRDETHYEFLSSGFSGVFAWDPTAINIDHY